MSFIYIKNSLAHLQAKFQYQRNHAWVMRRRSQNCRLKEKRSVIFVDLHYSGPLQNSSTSGNDFFQAEVASKNGESGADGEINNTCSCALCVLNVSLCRNATGVSDTQVMILTCLCKLNQKWDVGPC